MRSLALVIATFVVGSCSGGGGGVVSQTTTPSAPSVSTPTGATASPTPTGSVDCTFLKSEAAAASFLQIQILAQLRDQNAVNLITSGTMAFDPGGLDALFQALAPLESFAVPGLGDFAADLAVFVKANGIAKQIMANTGPVPQTQFDALIAAEGDVGTFITRQTSIGVALGEACP